MWLAIIVCSAKCLNGVKAYGGKGSCTLGSFAVLMIGVETGVGNELLMVSIVLRREGGRCKARCSKVAVMAMAFLRSGPDSR